MDAQLRCKECDAVWLSPSARVLFESRTACLACDGELELVAADGKDGESVPTDEMGG